MRIADPLRFRKRAMTCASAPTASDPHVARPRDWTPEQALAVFECLQAMRQALWVAYGCEVQQTWCDQLMPYTEAPEFDPDDPF